MSVLTPTWQRPGLLRRTIENVEQQTYPNLEHVIVIDGQDPKLEGLLDYWQHPTKRVPIRYTALGRNWSTFLIDSYAAAPAIVGQLLARGEYQCIWSDDERATPDHIEKMVNLLEERDVDLVYPMVRMHRPGQAPEDGYVIGADPPRYGQVTHWLYRTAMLKKGLYPVGDDRASDWACISRWLEHGATWAFLPEITFTHRYDL